MLNFLRQNSNKKSGGQLSHFIKIKENSKNIKKEIEKNKTPFFIMSPRIILDRYENIKKELSTSWGENNAVAYSYKTNYEVANKKNLKKAGAFAEVVSDREYKLSKKHGYKNKIILNGPNKTSELIRKVVSNKDKILIHIDNFSELKKIFLNSSSKLTQLKIGVRVNVNLKNQPSRFGFDIRQDFPRVLSIFKMKQIQIKNLHVHLGSDIPDASIYSQASAKITQLISKQQLNQLEYIDFGGGYPANGLPPHGYNEWDPPSIKDYVKAISAPLNDYYNTKKNKPTLVLEPGRYLVDDAVSLITKIIDLKIKNNEQIITINATINMLPLVFYRTQIIQATDKNMDIIENKKIKTKIWGASCQEKDLLYDGNVPKIESGGHIIFHCVGAYNQSMSNDFIFEKPKNIWLDE